MSWKKEENKKSGPHIDCRENYQEYQRWMKLASFRKALGHCDIWEYFLMPNKELYKHILWDCSNKKGKKWKGNENSNDDIPEIGIPLNVLFSWKNQNRVVFTCDLNFQQCSNDFKNHLNYYFPVAGPKEEEEAKKYENSHFNGWGAPPQSQGNYKGK